MKPRPFIMVVDDDLDMLKLVSRVLELEDFEVAVATGGKSALGLLSEHKPDLIVLDIMMPELDGLQVLDLIRRRSNVPIIMLTARCEVTSLHGALTLGADDYIRKPFNTRVLVARIRAKLRRAGRQVPSATAG